MLNFEYEWEYTSEIFYTYSRGANNCVQRVFEKKHLFHNDISNERLDVCELF